MNEGVAGIGISSTRGQASTSPNLNSSMRLTNTHGTSGGDYSYLLETDPNHALPPYHAPRHDRTVSAPLADLSPTLTICLVFGLLCDGRYLGRPFGLDYRIGCLVGAVYALPLVEIFYRFWHSESRRLAGLEFCCPFEGGFLETNSCLGYICPHFERYDIQRGKAHNLSKQIYLHDA
jgi:hypothetical protein